MERKKVLRRKIHSAMEARALQANLEMKQGLSLYLVHIHLL